MRRSSHRWLWFAAFLIGVPLIGWGFSSDRTWAAALGIVITLGCFYLSIRKLTCPKCGKTAAVIGADVTHCLKCGAPYDGQAGEPPHAGG